MKSAYFEKTGDTVDPRSDLGARLQTVASELLSLYVYGDFVLKQSSVQTADGSYLDNLAALRGITRKSATAATGELTFYLTEASETAITVPSGTVCSVDGKPFLQFYTTENAVIPSGEVAVTVPSKALRTGAESNTPSETVTVMVNPPAEVYGVVNSAAFSGGYDAESDTALRKRLIASYKICQTGFSAASVREQLLQLEALTDCSVQFNEGEYRICVRTKSGTVDDTLREAIRSRLGMTAVSSYPVSITGCTVTPFRLTVNIRTVRAEETAVNETKQVIKALCAGLQMGESLSLQQIAYTVAGIEGILYCEAASEAALEGVIYCEDEASLQLEDVQVNCYE